MLPKTGNFLQKGLTMQYDAEAYAAVIATALRTELGSTHRSIKTIRRWTGASERTATNWLSADNGPSGPHLASLAHHSDAVLEAFLIMAGRDRAVIDLQVTKMRSELAQALEKIDSIIGGTP
ncbi:hypothetical protein B0E33_18885 [Roseibium algicola]|uniref:Bacteriophage CII protein n=1 Tax=Roseibium algicola TaxID=2857014 RepID=A0ABM6I4S9_9HYPH|nr:XRE family transcriptional regulator [Roseibium aggregatum]AQQ05388.1 hypothetical protein B0E33_18885 [Roseibium aggregatum]